MLKGKPVDIFPGDTSVTTSTNAFPSDYVAMLHKHQETLTKGAVNSVTLFNVACTEHVSFL